MKDLSKNGLFIVMMLLLILAMTGCSDECDDPSNSDCPNFDPCFEIEPPIANFGAGNIYQIEEGSVSFYPDTTIYFDGDTILNAAIFYSLNDEIDSIYWSIGQDPRVFTEDEVFLVFDSQFNNIPINVSYTIVKYGKCFDEGKYTETLNKIVVPVIGPNNSSVYFNSKYRGVSSESPNDSITIEIDNELQRVINFPKEGFNQNSFIYYRGYDELYFTSAKEETLWLANLKINKDDRKKLTINYKISYDLGVNSEWHTFEGIRVE